MARLVWFGTPRPQPGQRETGMVLSDRSQGDGLAGGGGTRVFAGREPVGPMRFGFVS